MFTCVMAVEEFDHFQATVKEVCEALLFISRRLTFAISKWS